MFTLISEKWGKIRTRTILYTMLRHSKSKGTTLLKSTKNSSFKILVPLLSPTSFEAITRSKMGSIKIKIHYNKDPIKQFKDIIFSHIQKRKEKKRTQTQNIITVEQRNKKKKDQPCLTQSVPWEKPKALEQNQHQPHLP